MQAGEEKFALGVAFGSGVGVEQDSERAFQYFLAASDEGHGTACYSLGAMLLFGQGVEQDEERAAYYFQKAADGGNGKAYYALAGMYEEMEHGERSALVNYEKAAQLGVAEAQLCLADMLEQGTGGAEKDMAQAIEWYRKAAASGCTQAQTVLGELYGNGCPPYIEKDLKMAEQFFLEAAGAEDASACFHLGQLYKKEKENAQSGGGAEAVRERDLPDFLSDDEEEDNFLEEEVSLTVHESCIYWFLRAKLLGHPQAAFELLGLLAHQPKSTQGDQQSEQSDNRSDSAVFLEEEDDEDEEVPWGSPGQRKPRFRRSTAQPVFKKELAADLPSILPSLDSSTHLYGIYDSASSAPPSPVPVRRRYGKIVQPGTPSRLRDNSRLQE